MNYTELQELQERRTPESWRNHTGIAPCAHRKRARMRRRRAADPPPVAAPSGRELVFLFDYASPYTYLGSTQVERVAKGVIEALEERGLPAPTMPGVAAVSAKQWIAHLKEGLDAVAEARADVMREVQEARATLRAKDDAVAALDDAMVSAAQLTQALARLGGTSALVAGPGTIQVTNWNTAISWPDRIMPARKPPSASKHMLGESDRSEFLLKTWTFLIFEPASPSFGFIETRMATSNYSILWGFIPKVVKSSSPLTRRLSKHIRLRLNAASLPLGA